MCTRSPLLLMLVPLSLVGCASPNTFIGHIFRDEHSAYRVGDLPPTWHPFDLSGANLAFRDEQGGSILANANCEGVHDAPLDVLTNQVLFGVAQKQETGRQEFVLDGRAALRTRLAGTLDGVPVELELVVLRKDRCIYDFQLVARPDSFAAREPEFWTFVEHFEQVSDGRDAP